MEKEHNYFIQNDIIDDDHDIEALNMKYRQVFNNTGTAMVIINHDGIIVEANKEYEILTGYTKQELINRINYEILIHPDDKEMVKNYHEKRTASEDGVIDQYEWRLVDKKKALKNVLVKVKLIHNSNTRVVSLIDLTEQKHRESLVIEYYDRYRSLFENSKSIMLLINPDTGAIVDANDEAVSFYGFSKLELLKKNITEINILSNEHVHRELQNTKQKQKKHYNFKHKLANGEIREVEVHSGPIMVKGQTLLYSIIYDITQKVKVEREIKHRLHLENIITEISQILSSNMGRPDYEEILQKLSSVINAEKGFLVKFKDNNIERYYLCEQVNNGTPLPQILEEMNLDDFELLMGILKGNRDILYDNLSDVGEDSPKELELLRSYGIKSLIILPVFDSAKGLLGVMGFYNTVELHKWIYDDIRFLKIIGDGFCNFWIKEENQLEIQRGYERLENILRSTVHTLSSMVEVRDPYTAGHQTRVSKLAVAIGEEMKLSKEQLSAIRMASLLHDIGKIKIPSELLTKPGQLSINEFNLIMEHSQIGYDILKDIPFGHPVAEIVLQHHEKLDGSGYPQGLKCDEIFLESKIICVADVVEAMSSHRPYRPSLGLKAALDEVSRYKGIKYDSQVVDICIELFNKKSFEL